MSLQCTSQRTFRLLSFRWERTVTVRVDITERQRVGFIDGVLHGAFTSLLGSSRIEDVQGVDHQQVGAAISEGDDRPAFGGNEIVRVEGRYFLNEEQAQQRAEGELFASSVCTEFAEFRGVRHIVHSLRRVTRGAVAARVPIERLGRSIPLVVDRLYGGVNIFSPRGLRQVVPISPTITDWFVIVCNRHKLTVQVTSEALRRYAPIPEQLDTFLHPVLRALEDVGEQGVYAAVVREFEGGR